MAKVKIQGHASGTGVLTVTAPNTSTDRTITLPDETATLSTFNPDGAVVINESGADVDFRVESDTNANALFVEGSDGHIGVGVASSSDAQITVNGGNASAWVAEIKNTNSTGWGTKLMGGADGGDYSLLVKNYADTSLFEVRADGRGLSQFTAKAWASWNGTGTVAIRDSHNVSSVSDYGTGWYAPTYSNSMANTNYGVYACGSYNNANRDRSVSGRVQDAGSCEVFSQADNTATDNADCYVLIFGD